MISIFPILKVLVLFGAAYCHLITTSSVEITENLDIGLQYSIEDISYVTYFDSTNKNSSHNSNGGDICSNKYHKKSKQPVQNVLNIENDYDSSFRYEFGKTGAIILPQYKLVVCTIAKAGCTQLKMMIVRLLGLNVSDICMDPMKVHTDLAAPMMGRYKGSFLLNEQIPRKSVPCDPMQCAGEGIGILADTKRVEYCHCITDGSSTEGNSLTVDPQLDAIPSMFLDESWVTVAQVRDPWYRSISMYNDQIKRGLLIGFDSHDKDHFIEFISVNNQTNLHHTGDYDGYCGLRHLKYDIMIDMENNAHRREGFRKLFKLRPELEEKFTTGWESCTATGNPSMIDDIADTGHMYNISTNLMGIQRKHAELDAIYCNETTTAAVYERYKVDYELLNQYVGFGGLKYEQHKCVV